MSEAVTNSEATQEAPKQEQTQQETTSAETTENKSLQTDTQREQSQEETVTEDVSKKPSKDAGITKKEEVEDTQESTEEQSTENFKPDYQDMIQGFIDGDLSDEDYAAIEKSGLSKEQFDLMAEGYKAKQEANTQELYSYVGGEQEYAKLKDYGAENLSAEEVQMYNEAINSGNPKLTKMAVLGLRAMYQEQNGSNPQKRIESDGSTQESFSPFESQKEVIRALNDRRYGRDPEYTKQVDERRSRSQY